MSATAGEATRWRIAPAEHEQRLARVRAAMQERNLDGLVVFDAFRIAYLTGFHHIATERPIVLVVTGTDIGLLIPLLEQEHLATALPDVRTTVVYPEYPGVRHPMSYLGDLLTELGLTGGRLGADRDGHGDANGYRGQALSALVDAPVAACGDLVDALRAVKSADELRLLRESARWGDATLSELMARIEPGRVPREVALEASLAATRDLAATLGPAYRPLTLFLGSPARAVLHAGANTVFPHGLGSGAVLRRGDVLTAMAHVDVGGYLAVQGRTLFLGPPDPRCITAFEHALALRSVALGALRAGRRLCDAEGDIVAAYAARGVAGARRHHTGHGVGLQLHEPPYLDLGEPAEAAAGTVLSLEAALYLPELGGFGHGDTVLVGDGPAEPLTQSPLALDALTLEA